MTLSPCDQCILRSATNDDLPAIEELLADHPGHGKVQRPDAPDHHVVVLDAPDGGLAACAELVIEGRVGRLTMLAVADRFQGQGVEDRVIGVLEAMCTAFGARRLEVLHHLVAA
jgi:N-acetylglutamate synthase-like GNAT family acetyltransferase